MKPNVELLARDRPTLPIGVVPTDGCEKIALVPGASIVTVAPLPGENMSFPPKKLCPFGAGYPSTQRNINRD